MILFLARPIEAAVALLPIFEMVNVNKIFSSVLSQGISSGPRKKNGESGQTSSPAILLTAVSLSSYILAHASSAASPRALAYASLSLKTLLIFLEASELVNALFEPCQHVVQLSRQVSPVVHLFKFTNRQTQEIANTSSSRRHQSSYLCNAGLLRPMAPA